LAVRATIVAAAIVVLAAAAVTGLSMSQGGGHASSSASRGAVAPAATGAPRVPDASVLVQPQDGATGMPLNTIVAVTAVVGHLTSVHVAGPDGKPVAGGLDTSGAAWQSTGTLAPGSRYTIDVNAAGPTGKLLQQSSQFTTLAPKAILQAQVFPTDGLSVGVGMPIQIRFNHAVANKAAVTSAMHVTESTPVPGGWYWFSDKEVHFRPQVYWPAGEQVTLTANLAGVDAGNGVWAEANQTVHFSIGDARISTANVSTDEMTVTDNGQVVRTVPISAGRTVYPTMNGVHIALYRQQDVHMVSSSVGIPVNSPDGYDEHVYWDVNISDGGEFVHAAPWSTGAQGRSNVSHGCINISVDNAIWFFNFSRVGDIVSVVGSPRPASTGDHGTMDWAIPAAQWTPAT
jgi:lipoprotein-anchoring transpeptidase ErfK/SrfK